MRLYYSLQRHYPIWRRMQALNEVIGWHQSRGKSFLYQGRNLKLSAPLCTSTAWQGVCQSPTTLLRSLVLWQEAGLVPQWQLWSLFPRWHLRDHSCSSTKTFLTVIRVQYQFSQMAPGSSSEQMNTCTPKGTTTLITARGLKQHPWQGCWCDKWCLRRQLFISMVTLFLLLLMFIRLCTHKSGLFIPIHSNNCTILSPSPVSPRN